MKHFDEKTKSLTLITKVKDKIKGEAATKTYPFSSFVEGFFTKNAIDVGADLVENEYVVESDLYERLTNYTVELYAKQFTADELINGIHQGQIINTFINVLFGVLQGDPKNE